LKQRSLSGVAKTWAPYLLFKYCADPDQKPPI